jgi:hypothetical protein
MANWAWKPGKQEKRKEPQGVSIGSGNDKSAIPSSTSRLEAIKTGGWGHGLGNNVNATGNGVNAVAERMIEGISHDPERTERYSKIRATSAYKMARATAKRERQARKQYTGGRAVSDTGRLGF